LHAPYAALIHPSDLTVAWARPSTRERAFPGFI